MKDLDSVYKALASGQFCAQRLKEDDNNYLLQDVGERYMELYANVLRLYDLVHRDDK